MRNYNDVKAGRALAIYLQKHDLSVSKAAQLCGFQYRSTLNRKISGKLPWTRDNISMITHGLNLSDKQVMLIFFGKGVA